MDLRMNNGKTCVFKKLDCMYKFVNHSRLNGQHYCGTLYDHLVKRESSPDIMSKIFI